MKEIFDRIYDANPARNIDNLERRLLKAQEELGEAAGAYLAVSSTHNYKEKTWSDFREELLDSLIIIIDCLYTQCPDAQTREEIEEKIIEMYRRKMQKWENQLATGNDTTLNKKV